MSEINNNAGGFDCESNSLDDLQQTDNLESSDNFSVAELEVAETTSEIPTNNKAIDWQKVAHKLREYNRKLLKKVFKLEQELADTDNKYQSQTEKSQSSDRLVARQAEEIKKFQEQVCTLSQEIETSQQENQSQKLLLDNLVEQVESFQKQVALLERECALLQETCNDRSYQLITKTQQIEELSTRLTRQQRYALQYKAALENHLNKENTPQTNLAEIEVTERPIQAWSSPAKESPVSLPLTKTKAIEVKSLSEPKQLEPNTSKITEWPAPAIAKTKIAQNNKPQSLAAVKLPRFPRQ
jgi:chromosome segregation ATPase